MEQNKSNRSPEQQWNMSVWSSLLGGYPMAKAQQPPMPSGNERLPPSVHSDGTPTMGNTKSIGSQSFDGDKIAWMAFLNEHAQKMGGWAFGQDRQVTEQMNNASRIDRSRREAYRKYIYAGGAMGYNDWLRESGLHSTYGGY